MELMVYYSRNGKKPPFEVTIEIDGKLAYINCNCDLGIDKKICRHKINAIRGDKEHLDGTQHCVNILRKNGKIYEYMPMNILTIKKK